MIAHHLTQPLEPPAAGCQRPTHSSARRGVAGSLPWGVLLTFINDYLHINQRLSTPQATLVRTHARTLPDPAQPPAVPLRAGCPSIL